MLAAEKAASSASKSLVTEHGGTVKKTFGTALNGYPATLSATEAKQLAADPAAGCAKSSAELVHPPAALGCKRPDGQPSRHDPLVAQSAS
ncbi:protease inhibitor I9 family protein [Streptomyces sp. DG2A-72]|uniref:protease inhibitor I9 family protein n=1 Tax=Streptomyces sp. DG2A-72 TaxID=3051386 RepID=UPI003464651E